MHACLPGLGHKYSIILLLLLHCNLITFTITVHVHMRTQLYVSQDFSNFNHVQFNLLFIHVVHCFSYYCYYYYHYILTIPDAYWILSGFQLEFIPQTYPNGCLYS